jgi:hypothetical protein
MSENVWASNLPHPKEETRNRFCCEKCGKPLDYMGMDKEGKIIWIHCGVRAYPELKPGFQTRVDQDQSSRQPSQQPNEP